MVFTGPYFCVCLRVWYVHTCIYACPVEALSVALAVDFWFMNVAVLQLTAKLLHFVSLGC